MKKVLPRLKKITRNNRKKIVGNSLIFSKTIHFPVLHGATHIIKFNLTIVKRIGQFKKQSKSENAKFLNHYRLMKIYHSQREMGIIVKIQKVILALKFNFLSFQTFNISYNYYMSGLTYCFIIIMNNYIICPLCIMDLFPFPDIFGLFKLFFIFSTSIFFI